MDLKRDGMNRRAAEMKKRMIACPMCSWVGLSGLSCVLITGWSDMGVLPFTKTCVPNEVRQHNVLVRDETEQNGKSYSQYTHVPQKCQHRSKPLGVFRCSNFSTDCTIWNVYSYMEQEYFTPHELAKRLSVDDTTVRRWIKIGALEAETIQQGNRHRHRIKKSVIDALEKQSSLLS